MEESEKTSSRRKTKIRDGVIVKNKGVVIVLQVVTGTFAKNLIYKLVAWSSKDDVRKGDT